MIEPILYTYNAKFVRCIDGDTIVLDIDRGWCDRSIKTIRLARINTPEIRGQEKERGIVAKSFVEQVLTTTEKITIQSRSLDSFGRSIAEVWYWGGLNWVNLSDLLLEKNLAKIFE